MTRTLAEFRRFTKDIPGDVELNPYVAEVVGINLSLGGQSAFFSIPLADEDEPRDEPW